MALCRHVMKLSSLTDEGDDDIDNQDKDGDDDNRDESDDDN